MVARAERRRQQQLERQKGQEPPGTQVNDTVHKGKLEWLKHHFAKPIYTHLLVLLIGSGAGWQIVHLSIQRENQANDIRKVIIGLHEKILDGINSRNEAMGALSGAPLDEKIRPLQMRLDFYLEEYNKWESKLAQIEGRPPKQLDVIAPTAPHHFQVK
jgi:hypothetical protein